MKLLSINNYHYRRGGSDSVFLDHDGLFSEQGWETATLSMEHPNNLASPWSAFFVKEIEFGRVYGLGQKVSMATKVVYSMEARRKLRALLEKFRPDVCHVHCIYHHISPSVLPLLASEGIPVVLTAHDLKLACPAYRMLNRYGVCERCKGGNVLNVLRFRCIHGSLGVSALVAIETIVQRMLGLYEKNVDRIVVPSRFYGQKLVEWGWPQERVVYVPNFVEAGRFTSRTRPGKYFLYFGRLSYEKGLVTLVQAAIRAGVELRIVGAGPMEDELRSLARGHRGVALLGYKGGDELWSEVRGCRAVVLPSEWYENAPMSILEAYACGKPVVGARIGGIPELIPTEETGRLFASGDVGSLADVLSELAVTGEDELVRMGAAARRMVETDFGREQYFRLMVSLYESLIP